MIRDAIDSHSAFADTDVWVYAKGSYANNTNVRLDSDVDIVVECRDCMYVDYGPGVQQPASNGPPYVGKWTPALWRKEVTAAIVTRFGSANVNATGAIAIVVAEIYGSRPSADVVPSFQFRRYWDAERTRYAEGSKVFGNGNGKEIINWPQQQLDNGRKKNTATGGRYKYFVRALKHAENTLAESGVFKEKPSYLMECIVWNVPNATLQTGDLDEGFRATLVWLWEHLKTAFVAEEWFEPNERKYLFSAEQKWTAEDARQLVQATWNLLGYAKT